MSTTTGTTIDIRSLGYVRVDSTDLDQWREALSEPTAAVFFETPSNPMQELVDIAAVSELAHAAGAKVVVERLTKGAQASDFNSYRLILGEVARSVAAYAGPGIYLDVAISWVARRSVTCPMPMRDEGARPSGYDARRLLSHFWRLVLSSGTRPLRWVSALGAAAVLLAPRAPTPASSRRSADSSTGALRAAAHSAAYAVMASR